MVVNINTSIDIAPAMSCGVITSLLIKAEIEVIANVKEELIVEAVRKCMKERGYEEYGKLYFFKRVDTEKVNLISEINENKSMLDILKEVSERLHSNDLMRTLNEITEKMKYKLNEEANEVVRLMGDIVTKYIIIQNRLERIRKTVESEESWVYSL